MTTHIDARFVHDGYAIVRDLLTADEVSFYIARLRELAGGKERWTQPDGVDRHAEFWPLIFNERLLAAVREIFGPDVRYLPHNDLHLGFSSFSWHRDSVNRDSNGPDWDERREPYRIARVGIYLQSADSGFQLGLIRGSHRPAERRADTAAGRHTWLRRRTSAVASLVSGLSGVDLVGANADWVATGPGDAILFDPRMLHTGSRFHGEKYSVFLAFGVPNSHFRNHWHYYLHLRTDLGYAPIPPALADRLRAANLLADPPPADLTIEGAWIPSATFAYVARRFK